MSDKTITQQAYDKAVEAMGDAGKALEGQYDTVKVYIDINDDGSITFKDAKIGSSALADNVKAGLGTLKARLSDKTSHVYKAAFGDGKEDEGLWGAFKKNPINMVMAGVGALLAGLLFAESGMIGLIIAAVVGAVAFGGLSTYLTQPHEDPHASPSPAGTNQPAAGTEPAVAQTIELAHGKNADIVLADKTVDASEISALGANRVMLTEGTGAQNMGAVILADKITDASDAIIGYKNVQVSLGNGDYVKFKQNKEFRVDATNKDLDAVKDGILTEAKKPETQTIKDVSQVEVDDFVRPLATPAATAPTGPATSHTTSP